MGCGKIKIPKRGLCIGDLRHRITLTTRSVKEPGFGQVDFGEDFTDPVTVSAAVATRTGRVMFDGVNTDEAISHEIVLRHRTGIEPGNTWVELEGQRLRIVRTEDVDAQGRWLRLWCTERGATSKPAASA